MALGHWLKDYIGPHSGGGDPGYSCKEGIVTLTDESVTTVQDGSAAYGNLTYSNQITADAINVTFEGTEYVCENHDGLYGAPYDESTDSFDWSEYPFNISSSISPDDAIFNSLATETSGTYQVKVEVVDSSVTTTPCFERAVKSVSDSSSKFVVTFTNDGSTYTADHTFAEVLEAYNSGKVVEGAFKENAEGEIVTKVCTLAFIETTGVNFVGVYDVNDSTSSAGVSIEAFKFRLRDNNTITYTYAVIRSSN